MARSHARGPSYVVGPVTLPPFQAVVDDHGEDVFRFLVAVAGRQEADDCFQETLMSAIRAYPRLQPDANVRAWLFTIARRKAVDAHRARRRRALASGPSCSITCSGS